MDVDVHARQRQRDRFGTCLASCYHSLTMVTLNAHYDGKVIVPDEPLNLPANQKLRISVEPPASDHSGASFTPHADPAPR